MIHDEKTIARFMSKIEQPAHGSACWFLKKRTKRGYPLFSIGDKPHYAPRVAWEIFHGRSWPAPLYACHSCDGGARGCVNPEHIRPDTQSGNIKEAFDKGRATQGFKRAKHCKHGHVLTEENSITDTNGWRECKTCSRARKAEWARLNYAKTRTSTAPYKPRGKRKQ